jgi:hypothetical protein
MSAEQVRTLRRTHLRSWAVEWVLLGAVQGLVTVLVPSTAPALGIVALAALATHLSARGAAAGIGAPDGDVLLESGERLASAGLLRHERVSRHAALGWIAAVASDLLLQLDAPSAVAMGLLFTGTLAELLLVYQRRLHRQLLEAHAALLAGDDDGVRRLLESFPAEVSPDVRDALDGTAAFLATREGDGSAGLEALERRWSGGMDSRAAAVAAARAARTGDVELARRWLAAPRPSPNRYERFLVAQLSALVALAENRPDAALAAVAELAESPELPAFYQRQLAVLRVAALRLAGRVADADAARAALAPPFATDAWRRTAQRWLWQRLTGEGAAPPALPAAPPAPAAHPFAPPAEDVPASRAASSRVVGAVPVERMAVWTAQRRTLDRVRGVALLVLLLLAPVLLGLGLLLSAIDDDPGGRLIAMLSQVVGLLGLVIGGVAAVPRWFVPKGARPSFALDDGRRLPVSWWWVFGSQGLVPLVVLAGFVLAAGAGTGGLAFGLGAFLVPLLGWSAWRRLRGWRLLRDAHHPDPARMDRWRRPAFGPAAAQIGAWRALARLRAGDADGAAQEAREASLHGPDAGFVLGWLAAARGEVELDRLLAAPEPRGASARYRAAVALLLAVLATGRVERVAARLDDWALLASDVPNVHGDLLARLVVGARRALGQPAGAEPAGTEWVQRLWPFVP